MLKLLKWACIAYKLKSKKIVLGMMIKDLLTNKFAKTKAYYRVLMLNNLFLKNEKITALHENSCLNKSLEQIKQIFVENNGCIFINSVSSGGTFSYIRNQSKKVPILILNPMLAGMNQNNVEFWFLDEHYSFKVSGVTGLVKEFNVSSVTLNHFIWSRDFSILEEVILLTKSNIKLFIIIHDYFYLCPSYNLLNYKGAYCQLPDCVECHDCFNQLKVQNVLPELIPYRDVINLYQLNGELSPELWRSAFIPLFNCASSITFPSNSTMNLFLKVFPQFKIKSVVAKHDLQYLSQIIPVSYATHGSESMCVAIMGDIQYNKGMKIFEDLVLASSKNKLDISFLVIGRCSSKIIINAKNTTVLNEYVISDLNSILLAHKVSLFLFLSICPETFSFVIHEMMQTKLPIISFNLGAPGDFLIDYSNGVLVNDISSNAMYDALLIQYTKYKSLC